MLNFDDGSFWVKYDDGVTGLFQGWYNDAPSQSVLYELYVLTVNGSTLGAQCYTNGVRRPLLLHVIIQLLNKRFMSLPAFA